MNQLRFRSLLYSRSGDALPTVSLLKAPIFVAADLTGSLLSFKNGDHTVGYIQDGVRAVSLSSNSGEMSW